jgi:hypothetical protein
MTKPFSGENDGVPPVAYSELAVARAEKRVVRTDGKNNRIEWTACTGHVKGILDIASYCCVAVHDPGSSFSDVVLDFSVLVEDRRFPQEEGHGVPIAWPGQCDQD